MNDDAVFVGESPRSPLGIRDEERREPTPQDFADPRFDVIWELLKHTDATGNDVCAVLDRLDRASVCAVLDRLDRASKKQ